MTDRVLALWATPRSRSTAFEWMMRMRGDFICLHEPFGPAYYRGIDRRATRLDENPLDPTISYQSCYREILETRQRGRIFIKDMANYVTHMADGQFLDQFQHTFLIRDPAQSLPSMHKQWEEFTIDEAGYQDLHRLFDLIVDRYGVVPPVIDSDDLVDEPRGTVKAFCEAVDIRFLPDALEWERGNRNEVRWYGGTWHDTLAESTALGRQHTEYRARIEDVPFLQEMYSTCMPHYNELAKHKLSPLQ